MILIDTNVIVDLLGTGRTEQVAWSRAAYARALATEPLCANHVVLAEVAAGAARPDELPDDLDRLQIELLPLSNQAALAAGLAFAVYRRRGGSRETILPDFLIAGHAQAVGAALMTRDRRLTSYFPDLHLITPETHP